jgi:hypothetical protein
MSDMRTLDTVFIMSRHDECVIFSINLVRCSFVFLEHAKSQQTISVVFYKNPVMIHRN